MSLLLDALNKADKERRERETPASIEAPVNEQSNSGRPRYLFIIFIVIALCAVVAVSVAVFLHYHKADTPTAVQTAKPVPRKAIVSAPKYPSANTHQATSIDRTRQSEIAAQYQRRNAGQTGSGNAQVNNLYRDRTKSTTNTSTTQGPARAQAKATTDQTASAKTSSAVSASTAQYKSIKELPQSVQDSIPTLMYSYHHYQPGNSTVTINKQILRENSTLDGGLRVIKILPDGVVLATGDYQFELPARNSWLNFK